MKSQRCMAAILAVMLQLLRTGHARRYEQSDRLMSAVNLEHYYIIEENALSNADVLLRDDYFGADEMEDEEEHEKHAANLTGILSVVNETKSVHKEAGPDVLTFLSHPINIYHLFVRLDRGWRDGLQILLQATPCKKWPLPSLTRQLRYLEESLPGLRERIRVVNYMTSLLDIYHLGPGEITEGKIEGKRSFKPLSPEDLHDIVKLLHDQDQHRAAVKWLQMLRSVLSKIRAAERVHLGFDMPEVLNMMATSYFYMRNTSESLKLTKQVLKLDPENFMAQSNLLFYEGRLAREKAREEDKGAPPQPTRDVTRSKFDRLCSRSAPSVQVSRKTCVLEGSGWMVYKKEVLRHKPSIYIIHDLLSPAKAEVLVEYSYMMQNDMAWVKDDTRFNGPVLSTDLTVGNVRKMRAKRAVYFLNKTLNAVPFLDQASGWGTFRAINAGLDGFHLKKHLADLDMEKTRGQQVWAILFFLNAPIGGNAVFTRNGVSTTPVQGSALVFNLSKSSAPSFCPVLGGPLWVAIQPRYKTVWEVCVDEDE